MFFRVDSALQFCYLFMFIFPLPCRNFSQLPQSRQQFYLLSVFLGDIIKSVELCQHFKDTGRICH